MEGIPRGRGTPVRERRSYENRGGEGKGNGRFRDFKMGSGRGGSGRGERRFKLSKIGEGKGKDEGEVQGMENGEGLAQT